MNNKILLMPIFIAIFLLILPSISAQVLIQLGEPYVNIGDVSTIEFSAHSDYYEVCSLDKVTIPVLIRNNNPYQDIFEFSADKEYAYLPVNSAVIRSGKGSVLPLTLRIPSDIKGNITAVLDVVTKKEGIKRSVIIKTDVKECYLFDIKFDKGIDDICSCESSNYTLTLQNDGLTTDDFFLEIDAPEWINSTLTEELIKVYDGQKRDVAIEANPPCDTSGEFDVRVKAASENSKTAKQSILKIKVLPNERCYNTVITASDAKIDYLGKNIPVTIKNRGLKDGHYSLSVEGVEWHKLSQTEFDVPAGKEKTVNMALFPDEEVVFGEYNVDIRAESNGKEFAKPIKVILKSKKGYFDKLKFYINYFRYYTGLLLLVIVILAAAISLKRRRKQAESTSEKKEIKSVKEKAIKEAAAKKEERLSSNLRKEKKKIKWMPWIFSTVILIVLALAINLFFRYRDSAFLNKLLQIFKAYLTYLNPYLTYWKYFVLLLGIFAAIAYFWARLRRKRKTGVKNKKELDDKKKILKLKQIKSSVKRIKKGKHSFIWRIVIAIMALILLGAAGYVAAIYGKQDNLAAFGPFFSAALSFAKRYYLIFGGIKALLVILAVILLFKKLGKAGSKKKQIEKRAHKKARNRRFNLIRNTIITAFGFFLLGGLAYYLISYNPISYIQDLFVLYYPYILIGLGVLAILIAILHFRGRKWK